MTLRTNMQGGQELASGCKISWGLASCKNVLGNLARQLASSLPYSSAREHLALCKKIFLHSAR